MLIFIRFVIIGLFVAITAIPYILFFMLRPTNPYNTWYFAQLFKWTGKYILNMQMHVEGWEIRDRQNASVFVSNHQSNLDLFVGSSLCKKGTVSLGKTSIFYIPVFGFIYYLSGNVLINRQNKIKAHTTLKNIREKMKKYHHSIWIMPEGTRNPQPTVLPFKIGAFKTAIELQVPIVPVAISTYTPHFDMNSLQKNKVFARFLPEISTIGLTPDDAAALAKKVQILTQEHVDRLNLKY